MKKGTYYVQEITAPKGYALDETVHSVEVKANETSTINVKDKPQPDPVGIMVGKVDAYTTKNKPQGSASLEGAEFTICYYDTDGEVPNDYDSYTGKKAKWILKTDADGYSYLDKMYLVSGNAFYYNEFGDTTLPLGTITIQETKAPEGYKINSTMQVRKVTVDGIKEADVIYNAPEIEEEAFYGSFELTKFMSDDETSGASVANENDFNMGYSDCDMVIRVIIRYL